jgi:hypothetical protein
MAGYRVRRKPGKSSILETLAVMAMNINVLWVLKMEEKFVSGYQSIRRVTSNKTTIFRYKGHLDLNTEPRCVCVFTIRTRQRLSSSSAISSLLKAQWVTILSVWDKIENSILRTEYRLSDHSLIALMAHKRHYVLSGKKAYFLKCNYYVPGHYSSPCFIETCNVLKTVFSIRIQVDPNPVTETLLDLNKKQNDG